MIMDKNEKKINVLIADDHALFREMLLHTLEEEEDIVVVGEARDGKDAIELTRTLKPDILLLDIAMPRMDGIEATKILTRECPYTKIVILTANDNDEYVFKLVREGATGYLLKDTSTDNLISAIRSAYSGESVVQPRVASKILKELARLMGEKDGEKVGVKQEIMKKKNQLEVLTAREIEVAKLVGKGLNNREIAEKLFISEATVKTHVANAIHKLNLRDRVEFVLYMVQGVADNG